MDEAFKSALKEAGADVETTVRRFMGNEAMYEKFLKKLLDNPNFDSLKENMADKDYEEAYRNAHTLKGVAANLGLDPVQKTSSDLVEELRNKKNDEVDVERAEAAWGTLQEVYQRFYDIISAHK